MPIPTALNHVADMLEKVQVSLDRLLQTIIKFRNRQRLAIGVLIFLAIVNGLLLGGLYSVEQDLRHAVQINQQSSANNQELLQNQKKALEAIAQTSDDSKKLVCDLVVKINAAADVDITPEACKTP